MIRRGHMWTWKSTPPKRRIVARHYEPEEEEGEALDAVVQEYQGFGACVPAALDELQWVSPVFGRPKGQGKYRLILDVSILNKFVRVDHFKMEGIATAVSLASPGCFMGKLDLSNAYFHIGVAREAQPFLGFQWRGRVWRWMALPFGIATAPRIFSKLMKHALKTARQLGVALVVYLDDVLVLAPTKEQCRLHLLAVVAHLHRLGLTINFHKSILDPRQEIEFLGLVLDSRLQQVRVGGEKLEKVRLEARALSQRASLPVRTLAAFVGRLVALRPAIRTALLHLRWLDLAKTEAVRKEGWEGSTQLSPEARRELEWWASTEVEADNGTRWSDPPPTYLLTTDAALEVGWGATLAPIMQPPLMPLPRPQGGSGQLTTLPTARAGLTTAAHREETTPATRVATQSRLCHPLTDHSAHVDSAWGDRRVGVALAKTRGLWTPSERQECVSINRLELEALLRALDHLGQRFLRGTTLVWRTDNQTCMWDVLKMKAKSTDMVEGLLRLHAICRDLDVHLLPEYIPGELNQEADRLSRLIERQDWQLHPHLFDRIAKVRWTPTVDGFASETNAQLSRYWSWTYEPRASATDFLKQDLRGELVYGNPPFTLIQRVLVEVERQGARMLLVAPIWTTAPWWPTIMRLSVSPPLLLPRCRNLFRPASTRNQLGVGPPHWEAACFEVSGRPEDWAEAEEVWGEKRHEWDTQLVVWWDRTHPEDPSLPPPPPPAPRDLHPLPHTPPRPQQHRQPHTGQPQSRQLHARTWHWPPLPRRESTSQRPRFPPGTNQWRA